MTSGSEFSSEEPGAGGQPPELRIGDATGQEDDGTFADVLNGFTLDSGRGRRKRKKSKKSKESHKGSDTPAGASDLPVALSPTDQGDRVTSVVSQLAKSNALSPASGTLFDTGYPVVEYLVSADDDLLDRGEETAMVRPYALTGGRTKSSYALELETLVSTKERAAEGAISEAAVEQIGSLSIMEECRSPRSVAEIAAVLRVPLGVARVLIGDAVDAGLVTVHKTISGKDSAEAHLVLMERVLSGLRRL